MGCWARLSGPRAETPGSDPAALVGCGSAVVIALKMIVLERIFVNRKPQLSQMKGHNVSRAFVEVARSRSQLEENIARHTTPFKATRAHPIP